MNSADLKILIKRTDDAIKDFAFCFDKNVKPIETVFGFSTHNTNEFTNVYAAKKTIEEYLTLYQGCKIAARELPINYSSSKSFISTALSDVDDVSKHTKEFKQKGYFSIDSYFDVDINVKSLNPHINGKHIKYLFVEYKASKIFKYILLADDYIKYKIYTNGNENNTCFAFVNFDKQPNYPTILKSGKPDYYLLPKAINKSMFSNDDRVFIYIPTNASQTNALIDNKSKLRKTYKIINDIEKTISDIDENDIEKRLHLILNNDFYVNNIGAFKNGVTTAKVLLDNYIHFIKPIYDLIRYDIYDGAIGKEELKTIKRNFSQYERDVYGGKRNRSLKDGLNIGYKSSFNILVLFNLLNKRYNLNLLPALSSFQSDERDGSTEINYFEILNENTNILLNYYLDGNDYVLGLAKDVLSFIVKLYERILIFDEDGTYDYKEEYKLIKKTNKLQKLINEISSILQIKAYINVYDDRIKESGADFFVAIYNSFEDNNK